MTGEKFIMICAIVIYLMVMVYIGVKYSKRAKGGAGEFYLGGRQLGPVVSAMSAEASDMSSWLLMGLPGVAYFCGIADAAWTAIGLGIGTYLNWLIVAKRLRHYTERIDAITIPDFFSRRYNDKKNVLSAIAAVIIIVFFVPYTASGFAAVGKLFSSLFGVDYLTAMIVGAIIIVLYTTLGGFLAVSITDLIQSIIMSVAIIVVLVFGIKTAGGWANVCENAKNVAGYLSLTASANIATGESGKYGFITICSTLAWGLGYFGMPHILVRFMAVDNAEKIKLSRRIASIWVVISMAAAIVIGIIGYAMSKNGAIALFGSASEAEAVIVKIAGLLSTYGWGAAAVAGLIIAGILASTMSTADSQLLTAASSVSQNLLQEAFGIKLSEKASMLAARLTVIGVAIIAVFLAQDPNSSVFSVVSFAWAGFGAAFGPVVLLALFWKRSNKWGALAGMIAGGAMVFIWKYAVRPLGGAWNIYELLPAFIIGCIAAIVVSLLTAKPDAETEKVFEEVKAM